MAEDRMALCMKTQKRRPVSAADGRSLASTWRRRAQEIHNLLSYVAEAKDVWRWKMVLSCSGDPLYIMMSR